MELKFVSNSNIASTREAKKKKRKLIIGLSFPCKICVLFVDKFLFIGLDGGNLPKEKKKTKKNKIIC